MAGSGRLFRGGEVWVLVHATEDRGRVLGAVSRLLGEAPGGVREEALEGYFGEPLVRLTIPLDGAQALRVLEAIVRGLPSGEFLEVLDTLENRMDGSKNLYFRLDKQKAVLGRLRLGARDAVRVKLYCSPPRGVEPVEYVRSVLEGLRSEEGY